MREGHEVAAPAFTQPRHPDLWHLLFLWRGREGLTTEHPVM